MSEAKKEFYESVNGDLKDETDQLLLISRACIYIDELERKTRVYLKVLIDKGYEIEDLNQLVKLCRLMTKEN